MKVKELIAALQKLPQDALVCVNDEGNGWYHDELDPPFFTPGYQSAGEVVIPVNVRD